MRVLIIEDDKRVADFLGRGLRAENHVVQICNTGTDGFEQARSGDAELVLLDVMLPGMNGIDVCQNLRSLGIHVPILMLSAMTTIDNRVAGLRCGADDYLGKPFAFEELLARMDALMRRGQIRQQNLDIEILEVGDIRFDLGTMRVTHAGKAISFTAKELALLELLMRNPHRLYSRERILSNVWGVQEDPLTNIVDVYIGRLRNKLAENHQESCVEVIETVRGLGYKMTTTHHHAH